MNAVAVLACSCYLSLLILSIWVVINVVLLAAISPSVCKGLMWISGEVSVAYVGFFGMVARTT